MAPHSSTLAWKIPWTEEPGRLQSMGSLRVKHDWGTSLSLFTFTHWRRKWQPIPVFLPGDSQGRGAWWAAVHGVAQSWTRLKRLSSSRVIDKITMPIREGSIHTVYALFKTSLLNSLMWGMRLQHKIWRCKHSVHSRVDHFLVIYLIFFVFLSLLNLL